MLLSYNLAHRLDDLQITKPVLMCVLYLPISKKEITFSTQQLLEQKLSSIYCYLSDLCIRAGRYKIIIDYSYYDLSLTLSKNKYQQTPVEKLHQ